MSIRKIGTPEKIVDVAKSAEEFETLRKRVANENNLIRCPQCQHLNAKQTADGVIDIQHKRAIFLIEKPEKMTIKCPACGFLSEI
jgi:DNA-directed RNA polymerase subunit RPC12/RpoP